jgi:hypothetical protein
VEEDRSSCEGPLDGDISPFLNAIELANEFREIVELR